MADINVTNLTPETSLSLDGTEQFVMFDTAEGKRATVDAVGGYMIGRQLTQEEGTKTVSEKISEIEDELETIAETDDTLSVEGKAADAKAAGDRLDVVEEGISDFQEGLDEVTADLAVVSRYAARAMADLTPLQTTLNMLSWISAHGTMALTQDTAPVADHIYFVRDVSGIYVVGGTNYDVVANPVEDDIETYYELSIDESVTDYVKSHLNYVSGTGLYLDAGTGWKLLIASDGISVLHTENNVDVLVSKLALTQQLGKLTGAHSVLDNDGQRFYASDGNTVLADLGYASGTNASGGTSTAPYYTLGLRSGGKGNYSVVEGVSQASGYASHAEGTSTASGKTAHAEGTDTTSSGSGSHAQNIGTVAGYEGQTAIGKYNDNDSGNALEIGNGTNNSNRSNALEVDWSGNITIAGGADLSGDLSVGGDLSVSGTVSATGGLAVGDDATITGGADVSNDLTVGGDASIDGDLTVTGTLTAGSIANIEVEQLVQTGISVAANSYTDVTLSRTISGNFLGATVRISGTSNAVAIINNVTATTVVVRLRNVSSTALSSVQINVWVIVKT